MARIVLSDASALIGLAMVDFFARLHASDFRISKEIIQAVLTQVGEA